MCFCAFRLSDQRQVYSTQPQQQLEADTESRPPQTTIIYHQPKRTTEEMKEIKTNGSKEITNNIDISPSDSPSELGPAGNLAPDGTDELLYDSDGRRYARMLKLNRCATGKNNKIHNLQYSWVDDQTLSSFSWRRRQLKKELDQKRSKLKQNQRHRPSVSHGSGSKVVQKDRGQIVPNAKTNEAASTTAIVTNMVKYTGILRIFDMAGVYMNLLPRRSRSMRSAFKRNKIIKGKFDSRFVKSSDGAEFREGVYAMVYLKELGPTLQKVALPCLMAVKAMAKYTAEITFFDNGGKMLPPSCDTTSVKIIPLGRVRNLIPNLIGKRLVQHISRDLIAMTHMYKELIANSTDGI